MTIANLTEHYHQLYEQRLVQLQQSQPQMAQKLANYGYQLFLSTPSNTVDLYVCGLKPYGQKGQQYALPPKKRAENYHAYLDETWRTPYVARALALIELIQKNLLQTTPEPRRTLVSNWFFQRAEDAKQLKTFGCQLSATIPYHRVILAHYTPKVILCIGNSKTYSSFAGFCLLHQVKNEDIQMVPYLDRSQLKMVRVNGRLLLGVPHLSRYPITGVLEAWIQDLAVSYTS